MIRMALNIEEFAAQLTDVQQRQIPFALEKTLNSVSFERLRGMRRHLTTRLDLRNRGARRKFPSVIQIPDEDKANYKAGKLSTTIRILGGSVKAEAEIFERLGAIVIRQEGKEPASSQTQYRASGGARAPTRTFRGGFFVPAKGLRTASQDISRALYPVSIGLTLQRGIGGSFSYNTSYKGGGKKNRGQGGRAANGSFRKDPAFYFALDRGAKSAIFERKQLTSTKTSRVLYTPTGGRYQRTSFNSIERAIWFLEPVLKPTRRIDLDGTYFTGLEVQFYEVFGERLIQALRTAKPGGGANYTGGGGVLELD